MIIINILFILSPVIFVIALTMSMIGKGGGNFYILAIITAGISMHYAATTSQLIMMATSITALIIFNKHKRVDWKLALIIDPPTDIMALLGGYIAGNWDGAILKLIFAFSLIIVSIFMFIPVRDNIINKHDKFGYWVRKYGENEYTVNLWVAIPITAAVGFIAGAIGISGGAFKIPLMVLACGVPMEIAVGTSSAMVAVTALMGFIGHSINGNFNPNIAVPLAVVAVAGGLIGSRIALKSRPKNLKLIFALVNIAAAVFIMINIAMN